jgi:hypothetical protein
MPNRNTGVPPVICDPYNGHLARSLLLRCPNLPHARPLYSPGVSTPCTPPNRATSLPTCTKPPQNFAICYKRYNRAKSPSRPFPPLIALKQFADRVVING